jgi:transcription initiation factor IIE alpha subunit
MFVPPNVRPNNPSTSHLAANAHPTVRGKDRIAALLMLATFPSGLTDYELADLINRQQNSAGKRRQELRDNGLVEETTERRKGPSGSLCIVWRINEAGLRLAKEINERDR